jgi:hypothetical protein
LTGRSRVPPDYIKSLAEIEVVGAFRKAVRGVEVDLDGQMVKVVLGEKIFDKEEEEKEKEKEKEKEGQPAAVPFRLRINTKSFERAPKADGLDTWQSRLDEEWLKNKEEEPLLVKAALSSAAGFGNAEWAVARQLVYVERPKTHPRDVKELPKKLGGLDVVFEAPAGDSGSGASQAQRMRPWKREMLLAVLMSNTRENVEALRPIRETLAAMGIPIRDWLLEFKEHLYNAEGKETCEPVFFKDYLKEIALSMWRLSTEVFGHNIMTYESLAAQMREPDVNKIRRAVRRLDILTRDDDPNRHCEEWTRRTGGITNALRVGQAGWKWCLEYEAAGLEESEVRCVFFGLESVKGRIDKLAEPMEEERLR